MNLQVLLQVRILFTFSSCYINVVTMQIVLLELYLVFLKYANVN